MANLTMDDVEISVRMEGEEYVADIRRKGAIKHFQPAKTHTRIFVVMLGSFETAEDAAACAKASVEAGGWEN